jgi:hypothetical protein
MLWAPILSCSMFVRQTLTLSELYPNDTYPGYPARYL